MKESILTEFVREDLKNIGFTTYAEVIDSKTSIRCDMYAINETTNHCILFEAKTSFNLKVIEQAYHWKTRNSANEYFVLIPTTHKNIKTRKFARKICELLGIGVMEVNINNGKYFISVKPEWNANPKIPKLYDEQKITIASNSNNDYITPFKITVKKINEYMEHKNQEFLTILVKNIEHHYKSNISAVRAIKYLIEKNIIVGFYITKQNNKIVLKKHGF